MLPSKSESARQPRAVARPGSPRKCSSEAERRRAASGGSRPKLSAWPWTTRRGTEPATTTTRSTPIFTSSSATAGRRPLTGRTRSRTWNSRVSGNFYRGNSPIARNFFICLTRLPSCEMLGERLRAKRSKPSRCLVSVNIRSEMKRSRKRQVCRFNPLRFWPRKCMPKRRIFDRRHASCDRAFSDTKDTKESRIARGIPIALIPN